MTLGLDCVVVVVAFAVIAFSSFFKYCRRKIFDYPMLLVLMSSVSVMLSLLDTFDFHFCSELLAHPFSASPFKCMVTFSIKFIL